MLSIVVALPINDEKTKDSSREVKGILDGVSGASTSTPIGIPSGLGQAMGEAEPKLIIGAFQAVITKFDPSLVQGLPGLSGLMPVG